MAFGSLGDIHMYTCISSAQLWIDTMSPVDVTQWERAEFKKKSSLKLSLAEHHIYFPGSSRNMRPYKHIHTARFCICEI